jgi:MFS family permease
MLEVLKNTTYRHLFLAQVIALVGTGLITIALSLQAYDLAREQAAQVLGIALAIKMVAYISVAPIASAFAERLPRKQVLVGLDIIRALTALCLPFVTQVWQIYVLIFILQSASAAFTPTFQAMIPDVLPQEKDYTNALSLSRLAYDLENIISPMLAGFLLTLVSYHNLFLGTVLGFIGSALFVVSAKLPVAKVPEFRGVYSRIKQGAEFILTLHGLKHCLL